MNNNINLQNYEAFYLDYLEGNLDAESTAELFLFLENNPSLKSELEEMEMVHLEPEMDLTMDKDLLQKHIHENNVDDFIIASIENEINSEDAADLNAFLKTSPAAQQLAARYEKTILQPPQLIYPDKEKLKRRGTILYYLIPAISAAAVVLIFLLINPGVDPIDTPITFDPEVNTEIENTPQQSALPEEIATANIAEELEAPAQNKNAPTVKQRQEIVTSKVIEPSIENRLVDKNPPIIQKDKAPKIITPNEINTVVLEENKKPEGMQPILQPQKQIPEEVVEIKPNKNLEDDLEKEEEEKAVVAIIDEQLLPETKKEEEKIIAEEVIAEANSSTTNSDDYLRFGQLVNRGIRKTVLNEPAPSTEKVQGNELIAAVADKIDKKVKRKVNYKYKKDKKNKSFALTIGNFEFSRTKSE